MHGNPSAAAPSPPLLRKSSYSSLQHSFDLSLQLSSFSGLPGRALGSYSSTLHQQYSTSSSPSRLCGSTTVLSQSESMRYSSSLVFAALAALVATTPISRRSANKVDILVLSACLTMIQRRVTNLKFSVRGRSGAAGDAVLWQRSGKIQGVRLHRRRVLGSRTCHPTVQSYTQRRGRSCSRPGGESESVCLQSHLLTRWPRRTPLSPSAQSHSQLAASTLAQP
jgi:hypothetical protein